MAYLGPPPSQKLATPTSQYFSGNGSATAFTLNRPVNVAEDLNVFVNNVAQQPGSGKSYTATGTTLTFDAAPDAGTNNVYVVYRGLAEPTTRLEHPSGQPLAATTGTFSGAVSGTTGTFSGDLTVDSSTLKVDSTNNRVGINQASPSSTLQVETSTNSPFLLKSTYATGGYVEYQLGNSGALIGYLGNSAALVASGTAGDYAIRAQNNFVLSTNGNTQRLKVDTNGLMIFADSDTSPYNNTANSGTTILKGELQVASVNAEACYFNRSGSNGRLINFRRAGSFVGGINVTTSGTTYESNSDYRLKTAVSYSWDATTRLKQLKPARFKWIVDGDDAVFVDGFLAHEVQTIVPESVSGTKDAVDADGAIDPQGIDYGRLVPLLCKTILELEARITALESK
tara:strand:+ start:16 stop:1209 length:1194 start_codon:yes stop_codon:yes gene_type:complete